MPTGLMIMIFLTVTFGSAAVFLLLGRKHETPRARALRRLGVVEHRGQPQAPSSILKKEILQQHKDTGKRFRLPRSNNLAKLLQRSGCGMKPDVFLMVCVTMAAIGGGSTWVVNRSVPSAVAAAGVLGAVPYFYVKTKLKRRIKQLTGQFPDALELLTSTLRAGQAFPTGLMTVAEEMPDPIASEFRLTFDEQNYGVPMSEALQHMADRVGTMDMDFFVTAINIQRETGGNLVEILDTLSKTIRERFRILGHIKTLTAQGRLSGFIVGLLPVGLGLLLTVLNPGYMNQLFASELGKIMLGVAVTMQFLGFLWINKIVKIKV